METYLLKLLNPILFIIIMAFAIIIGIFMTLTAFGFILYNRLHILLHSLSQFINANIFLGHTDECISGRCYRENRIMFMKFINFIFFYQDNHCKQAYLNKVGEQSLTPVEPGTISGRIVVGLANASFNWDTRIRF